MLAAFKFPSGLGEAFGIVGDLKTAVCGILCGNVFLTGLSIFGEKPIRLSDLFILKVDGKVVFFGFDDDEDSEEGDITERFGVELLFAVTSFDFKFGADEFFSLIIVNSGDESPALVELWLPCCSFLLLLITLVTMIGKVGDSAEISIDSCTGCVGTSGCADCASTCDSTCDAGGGEGCG